MTLQAGLAAFQNGMGNHLDETTRKVAESQAVAVEAVSTASAEAAKSLQAGLADILQRINLEFDRFTAAMRDTAASLGAQSNAFREATTQSRAVADAFGRTAQDVRVAAAPLIQSGERIAGATERLSETVKSSVTALEASQMSSRQLAEFLQTHVTQMSEVGTKYSEYFSRAHQTPRHDLCAGGGAAWADPRRAQ